MPKRAYDLQPLSDADRAFARSLVIHEDAAILAFDKPPGLPVQTRNPEDRTLDSLLAAFAKSNGKRPRLVHRLDAQTSGVIVAARTQPAAAALSAAFAGRDVAKTYLALAAGPPMDVEGAIETPLARYKPKPELELMRAARPSDARAQSALTRWRVLCSAGATHLLELTPETGRMHQLRAHLSLAGRPILGDPYYGGSTTLKGVPVNRLMLHAWKLDLPHPSGGRIALKSPPPKDFLAVASAAGIDLALIPD
jgi:RluA family pseudouridine synthase